LDQWLFLTSLWVKFQVHAISLYITVIVKKHGNRLSFLYSYLAFMKLCSWSWHTKKLSELSDYVTGWTTEIRFPARAGKDFFFRYRLHTNSLADQASYPIGTRGHLPGSKAAGA
jgi:hypothetical protein